MVKINVRRLISFGKNSHVVTLPKQWIERNKLEKGSLISIDESKEGLVLKTNNVKPGTEEEIKTITINAENKALVTLKAQIVSAYLNNYNIIEVVSKDLETNVTQIKDMLRSLSGLEIINRSSTKIVAKDLISINEISIKTLIRRMDNITRSMMKDALECFGDINHVEGVVRTDEEVNRLYYLACRVIRGGLKDVKIANSLGTTSLKLHSEYTIARQIEWIADSTKRVCRNLKDTKLDKKCKNELKKLFKEIEQGYEEVMKSYYTNDSNLALEMEEKNRERIAKCADFFKGHKYKSLSFDKVKKSGVCELRHACGSTVKIVENLKEMAAEIKAIAHLVLNSP